MAHSKEAKARIKINKLLEEAGWRFFDNEKGPANISLEPNVKLTQKDIDISGDDFETTKNGFIDFLLLDEQGFPLVVLEAKRRREKPTRRQRAGEKICSYRKCPLRYSLKWQSSLFLRFGARRPRNYYRIPNPRIFEAPTRIQTRQQTPR